jgi:hypothetical protein
VKETAFSFPINLNRIFLWRLPKCKQNELCCFSLNYEFSKGWLHFTCWLCGAHHCGF